MFVGKYFIIVLCLTSNSTETQVQQYYLQAVPELLLFTKCTLFGSDVNSPTTEYEKSMNNLLNVNDVLL